MNSFDVVAVRQRIEENSVKVPECGCWIWMNSTQRSGYGDFRLAGEYHLAHRASYRAFNGEIPCGLHLLHDCDVRACVNPGHLTAGTNEENVHDCCRKGRNAALSNEDVLRIREQRAQGAKLEDLAAQFGVGVTYISNIAIGRVRKHIGGPRSAPKGKHPAKLVAAIRARREETGASFRALAAEFGTTYSVAYRAVTVG